MADIFSLEGRVALVTGASRGLGVAIAEALASRGALVVLNGRDPETLRAVAAKIPKAESAAFDVCDAKAGPAAIADIVKRHGKLDILVNNAGIQHRRPLIEWEDSDFERILAANLTSCFRLSREAARVMLPRKYGRIINTGSVAGHSRRARRSMAMWRRRRACTASRARWPRKSAAMASRSMRIAPGYFATELNTALLDDKEFTAWVERRTPSGAGRSLRNWGRRDLPCLRRGELCQRPCSCRRWRHIGFALGTICGAAS